jgi:hypothetical protein
LFLLNSKHFHQPRQVEQKINNPFTTTTLSATTTTQRPQLGSTHYKQDYIPEQVGAHNV